MGIKLVPNLSRKAQKEFTAMDKGLSKDDDDVKKAIPHRYNIPMETYRQKF